jgi:hypothetical protein
MLDSCERLGTISIRSICDKRTTNSIQKHGLPVELHFVWTKLLDDFVNAFAKVLGFEVGSSVRTLVLLSSIVFSIDALVVSEVNVVDIISALGSGCLLVLELVLVICVIRELVQIVLVFMTAVALERIYLFSVDPSLIYHI